MSIVKVMNLENHGTWEKQLAPDEFDRVQGAMKSRDIVPLFLAAFTTVRSNNGKNFAKDFFLPTVVNHAFKVKNIVGMIFAVLGALIFDAITLPFRLLTTIPKVIANAREEVHPLLKYLKEQNVDKQLLSSDHVRVRLVWEAELPDHRKMPSYKEINVNFIEQPSYNESGRSPVVGSNNCYTLEQLISVPVL